MTKKEVTNCKMCEKEIKLQYIVQKGRSKKGVRGHYAYVSNEGVCFEKTWFCNECWEQITKDIDKNAFKTALEYEEETDKLKEEIAW